MNFLVVTLAPTLYKDGSYYSYAPYVKEMDIWFSHVDKTTIVSPTKYELPLLMKAFRRNEIEVVSIPALEFNTLLKALRSIALLPLVFFRLSKQMRKADHIHLRCPGNIGLLGCLVQILFPKKQKTAKYAGNWDPQSKQPVSYKFQKWLLSNTFLTRNMRVLVYGNWDGMTKNIMPFFTASYPSSKVTGIMERKFSKPFKFVFVGSLSPGKRPLYNLQLVKKLNDDGIKCQLSIYGDGVMSDDIKAYVSDNEMVDTVQLHGNQPSEVIEKAYMESDFMLLASKSEGWPKVVAESMFWGTIPIVTSISCVPWMLDHGKRGILIKANLEHDIKHIKTYLNDTARLQEMSEAAQKWSQQYTLDAFENEIVKLLK